MFYIQDQNFTKSYTLHEAMINACAESINGRGAYAFATRGGISILLKDEVFDSLLERGQYSLIVGIDEITNAESLETLNEIQVARPNLEVRVFDQNIRGSLFHPKVSYFKTRNNDGVLIIGSGNLTLGGLRKNREAFSVINLSGEELHKVESFWDEWILQSSSNLKNIDDPAVVKKAEANRYMRRARIIPGREENQERESIRSLELVDEGVTLHEDVWYFYQNNKVLIAEIPRSGDRWKQANFDKETFKEFFGATPGDNSQRILLRNVNNDFTLSSIEMRPSVSVVSQNYRFELDAASGLVYPVDGKPIGVFIRLNTRMFLYHLYLPGEDQYLVFNSWLAKNWMGRTDRMKRIVTNVSIINHIISDSVFREQLI